MTTLQSDVHNGDRVHGVAHAPITLVEYGDYECPHCARAHPIVVELRQRFGDRLRFVFRNFPLSKLHPHALHAAAAAESVFASGGIDAFWRMHHAIFVNQRLRVNALSDENLARYAEDAGGRSDAVIADLQSGRFDARVQEDFVSGVRSGVNATPTFFINGVRFDGDWRDIGAFAFALDGAARVPTER